MKRLLFCLMLAFVATCALSCKKTEGKDNALLQGTRWIYMGSTKAVVDDALYTFLQSHGVFALPKGLLDGLHEFFLFLLPKLPHAFFIESDRSCQ